MSIPRSTPFPTTPGHRFVSLLLALLLAFTLLPAQVVAMQPSPSGHGIGGDLYDEWTLATIKPELRDHVAAQMPRGLPEYEMTVVLDPEMTEDNGPRLDGELEVRYVNTTGEAIDALPFRLYANGPADNHDAVTVRDVTVDGAPVEAELSVLNSVVSVPLPGGLAPEDAATVTMAFTTVLPVDFSGHYGIFNYSSQHGTWALAHWFPILAGRDPLTGWMLDPPSAHGDPIFSDTALFDVTITAPDGWSVVTTGIEFGDADPQPDGMVSQRYVSGPVRDFTVVVDEDFLVTTREVAGTTIKSWYNPGQEIAGEAAADYAAQSLELFNELLGEYPYVDFDIVPVDMFGAAGCEFPTLIYMASDYYEGTASLDIPNSFDFTIAHEVVHQWFYGLVGNNQYQVAYIDEGLTQYLSADVYFARMYDDQVAQIVVQNYLMRSFIRTVEAGGDQVVDHPTDDFPNNRAYVFAAYVKAPLGFRAIHDEIGDEAFFGALQAYVEEFTFGVALPEDLLGAFEAASGQDLGELWTAWFEETHGDELLDP